MGFFDDWKEKENSDYILTTEYVEELARKHDSSIKATVEYLLHNGFNLILYFKEPNGDFKRDKTLYYEEHNFDEACYEFLTHIGNNISEYKYASFETDAKHIALRYADRYFYKYDLPIIDTTEIKRTLKAHKVKRDDELFNQLEQANAKIDKLEKEQSADGFKMGNPTVAHDEPKTIEQFREALTAANAKVGELDSQLKQAIARLADKPANSVTHSNTDMQNVKKAAIKQFNRSLAIALIKLDYKGSLRKGDIVSFIIPYMEKLAFVLADENVDKAKLLVVKSETIYKTHLQGLKFKQGTQKNKDRERENIELLFKKQLSVTE